MKFTRIPEDTFKNLVVNAGLILNNFDPVSGEGESKDILGATSGGSTFSAKPTYTDFGADIDNCPKNTMELKKLEDWEITLSGEFTSINPALAKTLVGSADVEANKITPRTDLKVEDFKDLWLVADYSDKNTGEKAGFIAIKMMNSLSTGGFELKTADKEKGKFSFEFTAHYSLHAQDKVPFEVYITQGSEE